MSITWSNEIELEFLELYQGEPILWQSKNKDHKNRVKVNDAWMRISELMKVPVPELKKKKESLMSSYRSYKKRVKDSTHSGAGSGEIYTPIWFAYTQMDAFLGESDNCKDTINSEDPLSINVDEESEDLGVNEDSETSTPKTTRRRKNPPELLAAGEVVKDALSTLKETLANRRVQEDDECDLHGKVIAKKLRQLPEQERMPFVCEIYNMFVRREQYNMPQTTCFPTHVESPSPSSMYSNKMPKRGSQTRTNFYYRPASYSPPTTIRTSLSTAAASRVVMPSDEVLTSNQNSLYYNNNEIDEPFRYN